MDYSVVGIAKALLMDGNNNLYGEGVVDTLTNSSIEISTSSTELRCGDRDKLIDVYYHTPTGTVTISNVRFNLGTIAANFGAKAPQFGTSIFKSEYVTLVNQGGTVTNTPQKFKSTDSTIDGYVCFDGVTSKITFTGKAFTAPASIPANSQVIVTYYQVDPNAEYIEIPASIIPAKLRVVLTVAVSTSAASTGIAGYTQFDIGSLQLAGSMTFNMTPDGFVTTDLTGMMLDDGASCNGVALETSSGKYAKITTILKDVNWYDNIVELAIAGSDNFSMEKSTSETLQVFAKEDSGRIVPVQNSELTFSVTPTTSVTVGANTGILTSTSTAGTGTVTVKITNKQSIVTNCVVTVNA